MKMLRVEYNFSQLTRIELTNTFKLFKIRLRSRLKLFLYPVTTITFG